MNNTWSYQGGENCRRSSTRIYRSTDGLIGKVKRWRGTVKVSTCYFIWSEPDSAPEYLTENDARTAIKQLTGINQWQK